MISIIKKRKKKMNWGNWYLDDKYLCIKIKDVDIYEIRLFKCHTAKDRNEWIWHMSKKSWITDIDKNNLLNAFRELEAKGMI
jgi:hypothetical protein